MKTAGRCIRSVQDFFILDECQWPTLKIDVNRKGVTCKLQRDMRRSRTLCSYPLMPSNEVVCHHFSITLLSPTRGTEQTTTRPGNLWNAARGVRQGNLSSSRDPANQQPRVMKFSAGSPDAKLEEIYYGRVVTDACCAK